MEYLNVGFALMRVPHFFVILIFIYNYYALYVLCFVYRLFPIGWLGFIIVVFRLSEAAYRASYMRIV